MQRQNHGHGGYCESGGSNWMINFDLNSRRHHQNHPHLQQYSHTSHSHTEVHHHHHYDENSDTETDEDEDNRDGAF